MLKAILDDKCSHTPATNTSNPFSSSVDYNNYQKELSEAEAEWKTLDKESQNEIGTFKKFLANKNLNIDKSELGKIKNLHTFTHEKNLRIKNPQNISELPISSLHYAQTLFELIENIENIDHIKKIYKIRKLGVGNDAKSGLNTTESKRIKSCLRQGRELYLAGKNGTLMVKPLNLFYALTAYTYAVIVLNNPLKYNIDQLPGHHGLDFTRENLQIKFGGDIPNGTFTELICSYPTVYHKGKNIDIVFDYTRSAFNIQDNTHVVSMGTLLSMVPEIREFYSLVTNKKGRTHPLSINLARDPRNTCWEFSIGDGKHVPNIENIKKDFPGYNPEQRHGKHVVTVPTTEVDKMSPCLISDARGDFWYIENPFYPLAMPEICIHFLLSFAFSNIMRYAPDKWGDLLLNDVDSDLALITRKYISTLENKFVLVALKNISRFTPYII